MSEDPGQTDRPSRRVRNFWPPLGKCHKTMIMRACSVRHVRGHLSPRCTSIDQLREADRQFASKWVQQQLPLGVRRAAVRREGGSIMSTVSLLRLAMIAAGAPLAVIAGAGLAHADPPSPGDPCSVWHATTQDSSGQTMWCNHMMTGTHGLVWQYGGPSQQNG